MRKFNRCLTIGSLNFLQVKEKLCVEIFSVDESWLVRRRLYDNSLLGQEMMLLVLINAALLRPQLCFDWVNELEIKFGDRLFHHPWPRVHRVLRLNRKLLHDLQIARRLLFERLHNFHRMIPKVLDVLDIKRFICLFWVLAGKPVDVIVKGRQIDSLEAVLFDQDDVLGNLKWVDWLESWWRNLFRILQ